LKTFNARPLIGFLRENDPKQLKYVSYGECGSIIARIAVGLRSILSSSSSSSSSSSIVQNGHVGPMCLIIADNSPIASLLLLSSLLAAFVTAHISASLSDTALKAIIDRVSPSIVITNNVERVVVADNVRLVQFDDKIDVKQLSDDEQRHKDDQRRKKKNQTDDNNNDNNTIDLKSSKVIDVMQLFRSNSTTIDNLEIDDALPNDIIALQFTSYVYVC
jgi:long-subunit acyl-CoA synthetase (AMP-forming)